MYSSIGLDEIKDNKAPYLEKERLMSILKVRSIPKREVKQYNLEKKLIKIINMINSESYQITKKHQKMAAGG